MRRILINRRPILQQLIESRRHQSVSTPCKGDTIECKVLVVGGGSGGCSIAAKLGSKLGPDKVIVLEPSETHYYQPMFTMIGGGMKKLTESHRPMGDVLPKTTKWIRDGAQRIDPNRNTVITDECNIIKYEYLILALGIELNYDKIPGLVDALSIPNGNVTSIYSPTYVDRHLKALENFKSGNIIFTFPASPVKCPGAPQKIAYITEHYLRNVKKRNDAKIIYNTALPVIFGVKHYADALWKVANRRNIKVNLETNLIEVKPEENRAVFQKLTGDKEITTVDYSILHVVPPQSTPRVLRDCKDLVNESGFVNVNRDTLRHVTYPNVFAIGDCSATPNSKTMAAAAAQSGVLYKNIMAVMNGQPLPAVYDGYASCPLVTGYDTCILAEFDYNLQPLETFPIQQCHERYSMFLMKKELMPILYWKLMLPGYWSGPAPFRKMMSIFKSKY